ncbi:MAG: branched-chain amino acid ABC transporter substrate-binding protein [Microthrixaceae bacterium]
MRTSRTRVGLLAVVAIATISMTVAACSSDDSSSSSTTKPAGNTIRIGLEGPLSGEQSNTGTGMLQGAQLAAEELNAAGGVLGKQIEIVPIDDQADPAAAVTAAQAAIDSGLNAVVGPYNSGAGVTTLPLYEQAGLVPLRLTSSDDTAGMGFTLQPMTSQIAPVATNAITTWLGAKTVGIIFDSTQEYTKDAEAAMQQQLAAAGATVTISEPINPDATSYTDAINKVAATNPEVIYIDTYYPEAGLIAKEMFDAKIPAKCMADYGAYDLGFITAAGLDAAKACPIVGVPDPNDFPGSEPLVAAFTAKFSTEPGVWSPYTYDSVKLLAAKATEAGSFDAEPLSTALAATKDWKGWTGTVASFESPSGNRQPAPVTINLADASGNFRVDQSWVTATGFVF